MATTWQRFTLHNNASGQVVLEAPSSPKVRPIYVL